MPTKSDEVFVTERGKGSSRNILEDCITRKIPVYCVGIKGTGVCALAELLNGRGAVLSGSDTGEVFYTDALLRERGIHFHERFAPEHISPDTGLVIYSAAYNAETNVELNRAKELGIPMLNYPEALGLYSASFDSQGVTGVHGKTTTTAMAGALVQALGLPAQVLVGSAVSAFDGHCVLNAGNRYFIAETCEYRKHFLSFHPRRIVLTAVESDHQDYYPDYSSILNAFGEYLSRLPANGELIYCADDAGAKEAAALPCVRNKTRIPYGFTADGPWRIESCESRGEKTIFRLACFNETFCLHIPGKHNVLNAAAAIALVYAMWKGEQSGNTGDSDFLRAVSGALEAFRGSKRRAEIIGETQGILFMDDYGHHPTAIQTTLQGIKAFYPERRLVVSFMSHTYSRTAALLDEFARCFSSADSLILHKIYASAREKNVHNIDGRTLYEKTRLYHPQVTYIDEPLDAISYLVSAENSPSPVLSAPALFLTLGAGDNWKLGQELYKIFLHPNPAKEELSA